MTAVEISDADQARSDGEEIVRLISEGKRVTDPSFYVASASGGRRCDRRCYGGTGSRISPWT